MPLTQRIEYHTAVLTYKARNFMTPPNTELPNFYLLQASMDMQPA